MASQLAKYEFKRKLEELCSAKGRATELVSLYIPPSKQISDVAAYLRNEYAQSSNIKSKSTRKNVMWAIDSLMGKLKYFRKPPENGVVLFVGHKSASGDQTEAVSYVIEPPEPITTFLYRCDSSFYLASLEEMAKEKECYGLVVIDRKEATIGMLRGKRIETIKNVQSRVPSKHGMGGQSQRRFERLIEIAAHEYFKKIGDMVTDAFLNENIKGIIVGGPGGTKDFFVEKDYLHHELKKKIIDTFDVGYTDEYGLKELVENASSALSNIDLMREKRLIQTLMKEIIKEESLGAYGEDEIRKFLRMGAVETLLLSEELRKYRIKIRCTSCGCTEEKTVDDKNFEPGDCKKCSASLVIDEAEDIVEELSKKAEKTGAKVELVSTDSAEGETLLKAFGGIAALLRFRR
ncbi:MAG: peptide chain release factor aRF-1 [Thermoplasmatales archaeon]|nr:peptide chain release factor aRF-1 [Thermoplasmatales archaeon]